MREFFFFFFTTIINSILMLSFTPWLPYLTSWSHWPKTICTEEPKILLLAITTSCWVSSGAVTSGSHKISGNNYRVNHFSGFVFLGHEQACKICSDPECRGPKMKSAQQIWYQAVGGYCRGWRNWWNWPKWVSNQPSLEHCSWREERWMTPSASALEVLSSPPSQKR